MALVLRGVRVLVLFVLSFSQRAMYSCTSITSYTFLPRQKKDADAVLAQSKSSCFACCMLGTNFLLACSSFTVL